MIIFFIRVFSYNELSTGPVWSYCLNYQKYIMLRNYYSQESAQSLLQRPETLAVLSYGSACAPSEQGVIASGLTTLNSDRHEVWAAVDNAEVIRGTTGNCQWSKTDEVLCASIWITPQDCQNLEVATQLAYVELLDLLQKSEYQHPFRFWNYLPDINDGNGDEEQYKRFCTGRLNAFQAKGIPAEEFPAASALGHRVKGAVVIVFASRIAGVHHKNNLQVNAYQYPREYGISSPSFSRATTIELEGQSLFFVSGTASIIGHKTTSLGDLRGQLATTADNIQHLLQHAHAVPLHSMKVYLRHAKDFEVAKQELQTYFPEVPMIFTVADICRTNLLVEVECFCG